VQGSIDAHKEGKNAEVQKIQTEIDKTLLKMKKFYDFERFDINYLADAVLFTKAE